MLALAFEQIILLYKHRNPCGKYLNKNHRENIISNLTYARVWRAI